PRSPRGALRVVPVERRPAGAGEGGSPREGFPGCRTYLLSGRRSMSRARFVRVGRSLLALLALIAALTTAGGAGCRSRSTGGGDENKKADDVVLKADPNPVPGGPGPGTTTITWSTPDKSFNQIFVTFDDKPEKLFTQGGPGSKEAN